MKRFPKPKLTFNLVVVLVIFLVLVIESSSIAGFRPAFAATTCTPYEFIGARGSGESAQPHTDSPPYSADNNYGMGDLVFNVYTNLTNLVGADKITAYGVHYPAVSLLGSLSNVINGAGAFLHIKLLGAYTDSVRQGTQDVQNQIETVHASCPTTQFILSGYSQGAQAVGDALQRMPAADQQLVVAATFFGDPYFNANSWSSRASDNSHFGVLGERSEWPEFLHGDIFSYCQPHDPICGGDNRQHILGDGDVYYRDLGLLSNRDFTPHGAYQSSGDAVDAARELARVLGATTPPTGTVPLDLVFAIDTTGSMGGEIAQVRDNVTALANTIASTSANYRFALVDYKDGPDQGDPYRAQVDLNFTTDVASFANAVSTLSANGGGDYPESVYSGVMTALGLPWRTGVRKIVIVIGDAPGKDPEPQTNYTLDTVRQKALAVDPAQVYTVALTSEPTANTFMQNLANATGGQFVSQPDLSNFVPTLESTIVKAGSAPLADAGGPYSGIINDPVTFSAGGSRDDSEKIVKYDWDFNGDGVYDTTTDDPVTSYAYSSIGMYNLTVRVRSASGLAATATSIVTITTAPSIPSAPISLTATASDSAITLTWANASGGDQPQWYTITDATGSVIDQLAAQADGSPPPAWVDTNLTNGVTYSYKVSAGNAAGESLSAGPVTATPHVANQPPTANPDSYSTDNQTQLVIPVPGVLANDSDSDPGDTITARLISSTLNGSLSLQSDGSFTYTPKTNFVGTDKFTYQAVDSHGATSTPTEVDITVTKPTRHTHQHVVFIASTKPPIILVDWLVNGGYTISTTQNQVVSISGTGDFTFGRDNNSSLTMSVQKSGNQWDGTFTLTSLNSKRVLNGHGIVRREGNIIIGTFSGDGYTIGFVISG